MNTKHAIALLKIESEASFFPEKVFACFHEKKEKAKIKILPNPDWVSSGEQLVWLEFNREVNCWWQQEIKIQKMSEASILAFGKIIDPSPEAEDKKYIESKRLKGLAGSIEDMLLVLLRIKGIKGLREKEMVDFIGFMPADLPHLLTELELKGLIKILGWQPFLLISRESLNFLVEQILAFLKRYHQKHPEALGVPADKIRKRFHLPRLVLSLALGQLKKEKKIIIHDHGQVSLSFDEIPLTEEELKILAQLEEMCYRGEFRRVSFDELKKRFRLSHRALEKLLAHLVARKKIFQSANGFYLHSHWLEEIINRLRQSGKRELTIAEFKAMTGLSRKYAIPLLELLDKMGVTRRKGSSREIL